jgi:hypothetical protein
MQINVNAKLDGLVPLKFSCPVSSHLCHTFLRHLTPAPHTAHCAQACGGNCSFTVPVAKREVSFAMPPCPIPAAIRTSFTKTLPAVSPINATAKFDGLAYLMDGDRQLAAVYVSGSVGPGAV